MIRHKCLRTLLAGSLLAAVSLPAQTAAPTTYNNLSLKGAFTFVESGLSGSAGAIAAVGALSADGNGAVTGNLTVRWPGLPFFSANVTGQYQINQDGTGSLTIGIPVPSGNEDQPPVSRRYSLVFSKRGLSGIASDQGIFSVLELEAQPTGAVNLSSVAGNYGYTETGVLNSSSVRIAVGDFVLDATGGVQGVMEERTAGRSALSYTFTGNYTVSASGAGTITVERAETNSADEVQIVQSKFNFVAGKDGKLSAIRLDSGSAAVGQFERQ